MRINFDHFSILAPLYEHFIPSRTPEKIISLANFTGKENVLDAGGGTGRVSQYLRSKVAQIVVADESIGMLREAQKKAGLQPVLSFTENLPFQNNSFDRIILVDAFHHVADQLKTSEELWRILKLGGLLIIEEPDIHALGVKFIALAEKLMLMRSHFSPPQKIAEIFRSQNAKSKVEVHGSTSWIVVRKDGSS